MEISYEDEKTKKLLEDPKLVSKTYGQDIVKKYENAKEKIINSETLALAKLTFPSLNIKKIVRSNKMWELRINKKYRVNFKAEGDNDSKITKIIIISLHPHKYKK